MRDCTCSGCTEKAQEVFFHLARSKGFSVDTASSAAYLTLDNLKRFQVIVWNNNHSGIQSVPDTQARNAVSEYVRQGGGWLLVNLANDHLGGWPFLDSLIGPGTNGWQGKSVPALLVVDSSAQKHPELRYFVLAMPDTIPLRTNWLRVNSRMDEFEQLKTIYRVKNADWIAADPHRITDKYIWAGTRGLGKALSIPLGWHGSIGASDIMAQADSAVPKLFWQGLRWLAGDFQGGCTNPAMPNFEPQARVDDGSCPALGIRVNRRQTRISASVSGRRVRFNTPISGGSRLRMLDLRGHTVWTSVAPVSADAIDLPDGLRAGLYILEGSGTDMSFQARLLVP